MRYVLDTSVLVAAVRSNVGMSNKLLSAALNRKFVPIATNTLFTEYEAVLKRPEHLNASGLDLDDIDVLLDTLETVLVRVHRSYLWRTQLRDPGDDMVLEAAINGRADAIVTFNIRDFGAIPQRFNIRLLRPKEAFDRLV